MGVCDDLVVIYVIYIDLKSSCVSIFFGHPEMRYITDAKHITVAWCGHHPGMPSPGGSWYSKGFSPMISTVSCRFCLQTLKKDEKYPIER